MTYLLANKCLDTVIVKFNGLFLDLLRAELLHLADNLSSGKLLNEQSGTLGSILAHERIRTSLITERSICLETMSL